MKLIKFTWILFLLTGFYACDNCRNVDCEEFDAIYLQFDLQRNGGNIFLEQTALLSINDIVVNSSNPFDFTTSPVLDDNGLVSILTYDNREYSIAFGSLDTVMVNVALRSREANCCLTYDLDQIELDGETLCQEDCEPLITLAL